jgi:hypothetical protein
VRGHDSDDAAGHAALGSNVPAAISEPQHPVATNPFTRHAA